MILLHFLIMTIIAIIVLNMETKTFGFMSYLYYNFVSIVEMCDDKWVMGNISGLRLDVERYVHGQPFIVPIVLPALELHMISPKKPLVLCFLGMPGTGKTYVADLIAKNMYLKGVNSKFNVFHGSFQFPGVENKNAYKIKLQRNLKQQIWKCPQSLFIFDDIDEIPLGVLDALKPFIDYSHPRNEAFRKSIFIFLSNAGSKDILEMCIQFLRNGIKREEYRIKEFEPILRNISYKSTGGLGDSSLIDHNLIDYYIPFLPLEKEHVRMCIKEEAVRQGVPLTDYFIMDVMNSLNFIPDSNQIFPETGCKNIASKVGHSAFNLMSR